jgi:Flp pilus assembly protein TadG
MAGSQNLVSSVEDLWNCEDQISRPAARGQAVVEFTLIFILILVLAWIPADFGLAFYTGQLAQNAAREGARIAAADPDLLTQTGNCTLPCSGAPQGSILAATAARISSALLTGTTITVAYPVGTVTCNQKVRVQVSGSYNFFFYRVLSLFGATVNPVISVDRQTEMRWEHQPGCIVTGSGGGNGNGNGNGGSN